MNLECFCLDLSSSRASILRPMLSQQCTANTLHIERGWEAIALNIYKNADSAGKDLSNFYLHDDLLNFLLP